MISTGMEIIYMCTNVYDRGESCLVEPCTVSPRPLQSIDFGDVSKANLDHVAHNN